MRQNSGRTAAEWGAGRWGGICCCCRSLRAALPASLHFSSRRSLFSRLPRRTRYVGPHDARPPAAPSHTPRLAPAPAAVPSRRPRLPCSFCCGWACMLCWMGAHRWVVVFRGVKTVAARGGGGACCGKALWRWGGSTRTAADTTVLAVGGGRAGHLALVSAFFSRFSLRGVFFFLLRGRVGGGPARVTWRRDTGTPARSPRCTRRALCGGVAHWGWGWAAARVCLVGWVVATSRRARERARSQRAVPPSPSPRARLTLRRAARRRRTPRADPHSTDHSSSSRPPSSPITATWC